MQRALLAAVVLLSTACGQRADDSSAQGVPGFNPFRPIALTAASMTFERDMRPVDGPLTTIELVRDERGTYELTLTSKIFDLEHGQESESSESLGFGYSCTQLRFDYTCEVDRRPVDGLLSRIVFTLGEDGYDVVQSTTGFDRIEGVEKTASKELAFGLKIKQAAAEAATAE
jgi:hypothetical protein